MAAVRRARDYLIYFVAVFVSAVFALFGQPAPVWVMKVTGEVKTGPSIRQIIAHAAKTHRPARITSKRRATQRRSSKPHRLARRGAPETGLAAAAIAAVRHS